MTQIDASPRHRLGQNFLIDGNLMRLVAKSGNLQPGEHVIEVGPGTGSLTEELLAAGCRVTAVEIDRDLAGLLRNRLGSNPQFELIEGDALAGKHAVNPEIVAKIAGGAVKLVANLPYQIASPLVIEMLIAGAQTLVFTVQREVGQRLKAGADSDLYGPLSVMAQLLSTVEILRVFPPQAFWPRPKIESALVRMTRQDRLGKQAEDFSRFLHGVFSYRRKMLRKAMTEAGIEEKTADAALAQCGFSPRIRPEELAPDHWLDLFARIKPTASSTTESAV